MNIKQVLIMVLAFALALPGGVAQAAVKPSPYKNGLTQRQWFTYGVNPWRADTDNDGYSDKWEVQKGWCPTSDTKNLPLKNKNCRKGTVDLVKKKYTPPSNLKAAYPREVRTFASCSDLEKYARQAVASAGNPAIGPTPRDLNLPLAAPASGMEKMADGGANTDYSATNVQVAGVDEADMVKTDGTNIYTLVEGYLVIVRANPAATAERLSKTYLSENFTPSQLYLLDKYVLVLGTKQSQWPGPLAEDVPVPGSLIRPSIYPYYRTTQVAQLWDVRDPRSPAPVRSFEFDGTLLTSRLTGGYAYLVLNSSPQFHIMSARGAAVVTDTTPLYREARGTLLEDKMAASEFKPLLPCNRISYIYPQPYPEYLQIVAIPLANPQGELGKQVIMGTGHTVYASDKNLYVAAPLATYWTAKIAPAREQTEIYKFALSGKSVTFAGSQTVPGTVLNQFSMDEFDGNFRIATTKSEMWWGRTVRSDRQNNLYVLDKDLNRIGWYENFGTGERIYAARFMGRRAYVVTFQETDPLFVFDLENPRVPKLLGELHIPGYSNYLHPYDDTHVIGVGKNAVTAQTTPGFAWYQGMKLALFDVTDPGKPREMFKTEIGDRGTDSPALYDHHAFLFSKEKNLLALPVTLAEIPADKKDDPVTGWPQYGTETFQGLYVYGLDLQSGFTLRGRITHAAFGSQNSESPTFGRHLISRALYIRDTLYALSPLKVTMHQLGDLVLLKEIIF